MDLTKDVVYRGFSLNDAALLVPGGAPLVGCAIKRIQYSDVVGEGYREKRAQADGYDASDVWLGFRPISAVVTIYGSSRGDLWDRVQDFRRAFTPTLAYAEAPGDLGFMDLTFSQSSADLQRWPGGVIPLAIRARPDRQPSFVLERDRANGEEDYGFAQELQASLWAKDPRIYVVPPVERAISGTSGSGVLTNRGDYPAPLDIILYTTDPDVVTFTASIAGSSMVVTIPADPLPRLVRIDSTNKVCTMQVGDTETLRMDLVVFTGASTWPRVLPAPSTQNTYSWSTTGGPLAVGSEMMFSEALA